MASKSYFEIINKMDRLKDFQGCSVSVVVQMRNPTDLCEKAPLLVIPSPTKEIFLSFFLTLLRFAEHVSWFKLHLVSLLHSSLFVLGGYNFKGYFKPLSTTQLTQAPWNCAIGVYLSVADLK